MSPAIAGAVSDTAPFMQRATHALLGALAAHRPGTPREAGCLTRMRGLLRWLPRPFDEHADAAHVTGSALVLDAGGHVLLHRHKHVGRWLQPGGHLDPGEDAAQAAVREVGEETGLAARHPAGTPRLLHVDVHEGPRSHLHLDVRYLLYADGDAPLQPAAGESPDVAWLDPEVAAARADAGLAEAIAAACRLHRLAPEGRP